MAYEQIVRHYAKEDIMDAIYARQSIDKKDSISIETQIELCEREISPGVNFRVYSDKGYSGSNINRPAFQEMLEDVKQGKIERIITYRLDRISRSVLDFAKLIDLFEKFGVSFNSTQEKFDTSTPMGKAMLNITMVFAQLERETIQQRIKDNYYSRGEKGMYLGGPAPFGFRRTKVQTETGTLKLLEPNPDTVETVKQLFDLYGNELLTLGQISRYLNENSILSPYGSKWDSCKISRILRNPISVMADAEVYRYYVKRGCSISNEPGDFVLGHGCYLYGKRETHERKYTDVTDHVLSLAPSDGIVSPELFLRCQKRLDKNAPIDNHRRSQITWLTGLMKCAKCGYGVVPKSSDGGKYHYLYCIGRTSFNCCDIKGNLGTLKAVEAVIEERIFRWADQYAELKSCMDENDGRERNLLRCQIEGIELKITKLIDMATETNEVTAKYLNDKISELEAERQSLSAELENLGGRQNDSFQKEIKDLAANWDNLDISQKNHIAALLISQINIAEDEIEIVWNYDFDKN